MFYDFYTLVVSTVIVSEAQFDLDLRGKVTTGYSNRISLYKSIHFEYHSGPE